MKAATMNPGPVFGLLAIMAAAITTHAYAAGDAKKGEVVFQRCAICHNAAKGAGSKVGPDLWGVVGRKAGTEPNFYYSPAMKNSNIVWTNDRLEAYVENPAKVVPGNRMAFAGLPDKDADDLVAYLDTLK